MERPPEVCQILQTVSKHLKCRGHQLTGQVRGGRGSTLPRSPLLTSDLQETRNTDIFGEWVSMTTSLVQGFGILSQRGCTPKDRDGPERPLLPFGEFAVEEPDTKAEL